MSKIKLSTLKPNPDNPRTITDDHFKKLVDSVKDFPKMLELRPIVIESFENPVILGGNMRFRALKEAGFKEVPKEWIKEAKNLTEEEKKEFIIKDNVNVGQWDEGILRNNFSELELNDWGLDLSFSDETDQKKTTKNILPYNKTHVLLSFPPEKILELKPFLDDILQIQDVDYEQSSN